MSACFFGRPCRSTMPSERCFSVTVVGAAAVAGALGCDVAVALPADLAAGLAAAGFEAVRDLVPAPAFAGAAGAGVLFAFAGSLVLVAFLAMTLWSFLKSRLDTFPRVLSSQSPVRILANGALGQVRVEPLWAAREPAGVALHNRRRRSAVAERLPSPEPPGVRAGSAKHTPRRPLRPAGQERRCAAPRRSQSSQPQGGTPARPRRRRPTPSQPAALRPPGGAACARLGRRLHRGRSERAHRRSGRRSGGCRPAPATSRVSRTRRRASADAGRTRRRGNRPTSCRHPSRRRPTPGHRASRSRAAGRRGEAGLQSGPGENPRAGEGRGAPRAFGPKPSLGGQLIRSRC